MKKIPNVFLVAGKEFMRHCVPRLSAALAFYSVFSIGPLLIITIGISGAVFGDDAVRGELEFQLDDLMGSRAAATVEDLVASAGRRSESPLMTAVGLITLFFGATGVFGQLKDSLNTIWEVKLKAGKPIVGFLKNRLLSFSMILGIGFLLLISMVLTTTLQAFGNALGNLLPFPAALWQLIGFTVSFLVVTLLFALIFRVLPDVKIRWSDVWVGAGVTSLLFSLGKLGIGIYLAREETMSPYGAAGALVLLLLWVYFTSIILLYGAEFTRAWANIRGEGASPNEFAREVEAHEVREEGMKIDD